MVSPGVWVTEEPATPVSRRHPRDVRQAAPVGSMLPALTAGGNFITGNTETALQAFSIHPENRHRP